MSDAALHADKGEMMLDCLESRRLLTASPVDTTWYYNPAALTKAAGQHVTVGTVVPAAGGQYLMLGKTTRGATVVIRLNENGSLDTTFGNGGVADPAINDGTGVVQVTSDTLGYTYVYDQSTVTRLRGNGTRDIHFGRRGRVDFSYAGDVGPLDAEPDNAGGIDLVVHGESTASLVHINSAGASGVLWSGQFNADTGPAAGDYAVMTFGYVAHLTGGKFVVVTSRQYYGENSNTDSLSPGETGGDADVFYLSKKGETLYTRHFDTGAAVTRADSNSDADPVILYYGNRKLYIRSGYKMSRQTLNFSGTPNLPSGGLITLSTQPVPDDGAPTPYVTTATLYTAAGQLDPTFQRTGTYSLADRIDPTAGVVDVFAARANDVLIGSWVSNYDSRGHIIVGGDDLNLLRLWTTDQVSPTLVSTRVKKQTAIVTVRYRAKGGVDDSTINNGDLLMVASNGAPYPSFNGAQTLMRLLSKQANADGTVTAQYAATVSAAGVYDIQTVDGSVLSERDYFVNGGSIGRITV